LPVAVAVAVDPASVDLVVAPPVVLVADDLINLQELEHKLLVEPVVMTTPLVHLAVMALQVALVTVAKVVTVVVPVAVAVAGTAVAVAVTTNLVTAITMTPVEVVAPAT
jgi:hypothetical protein